MSSRPRAARVVQAPASPGARVRLAATLAALAETDRLILSLHLLEGLTVLEIAGTLKLKTHEVEHRRRTALAAIARKLGTGSRRAPRARSASRRRVA